MRFAVLADAHIGRSIPLAVGEHRRRAFSEAFSRAVDAVIEADVDYVFFCGDLFERRTLRPNLVQFAHDELYRLALETERRHGKRVKVFIIRGNHDGRPQSDTLDYLKHPLARYLVVFDDENIAYEDEKLHAVGLGYYDEVDEAFETFVRSAFKEGNRLRVLMIHGFVSGYHEVPPYNASLTIDQLNSIKAKFVFVGHYHKHCPPKRLPGGGWLLTPGSLEMYDFAESQDKGFYLIDNAGGEPIFRWVAIEPIHVMKQVIVEAERRQIPDWYRDHILDEVRRFAEDLRTARKAGYLRVVVRGALAEGFPSDIDLSEVDRLRNDEPLLIWVDADTMELELPQMAVRPDSEQVDVAGFFSGFGEFAGDIQEMHGRVKESLEDEASTQTMLLTPSQRTPLQVEWLRRFEVRIFRREEK